MIDVCAFSDGHGLFPKDIKPFDLMLIGGDNIDLYLQSSKQATIEWYTNDFVNWINGLPFKDKFSKVIFICGNHEVGFYKFNLDERKELTKTIKTLTNGRAIYLENETYTFHHKDRLITIFGTPYCKIFGRWAFMQNSEDLRIKYNNIPKKCDILLTHDAPYGTSDLCFQWQFLGRNLQHIGNVPLQEAILEKKPKLCIHGDLHSSNHELEKLGDTKVYCVSLVDENYECTYSPLYLSI